MLNILKDQEVKYRLCEVFGVRHFPPDEIKTKYPYIYSFLLDRPCEGFEPIFVGNFYNQQLLLCGRVSKFSNTVKVPV